jgi:hypothetical protein
MSLLRKYTWTVAGMVLGAMGGFFYWKYIGCQSGTCMITSVWHNSTAYGALLGILGAGTMKDLVQKDKTTGEAGASGEG